MATVTRIGTLTSYLLRRLALTVPTLALITLAVYAGIRMLPGRPTWAEDISARPQVEAWLLAYHVDEPLLTGYARWVGDLMRLDLGVSLGVEPGRPVAVLIADSLPCTLILGTSAFILTLATAIPLGALAAWRPASAGARASTALLYIVHALPAFWIALALQSLIAERLGLLPVLGAAPPEPPAGGGALSALLARAPYFILPAVSITLGSLAFVIRYCRSSLLEASAESYALAARARGAGPRRVLLGHALANAGVPLISLAGLMLPGVVGGSILVETIFALPGVGRLFSVAASRRDYPVMMGVALLTSAATLASTLAADLLYRAVDPRLVLEDGAQDPT